MWTKKFLLRKTGELFIILYFKIQNLIFIGLENRWYGRIMGIQQ